MRQYFVMYDPMIRTRNFKAWNERIETGALVKSQKKGEKSALGMSEGAVRTESTVVLSCSKSADTD